MEEIVIDNLCKVKCIQRKKCNERFTEILKTVKGDIVYLCAECGQQFKCEAFHTN